MSKAKTANKVLRTALKRIQKGWTKGEWYTRDKDGNSFVCLEGALFGFCSLELNQMTDAQLKARELVIGVINERSNYCSIPTFNDAPETELDDVIEVIKLAIIRDETGYDPEDDYLDDEEIESLLGG
jgi:hypothetical protein